MKRILFISILLINTCVPGQHIHWKSFTFGPYCCMTAVWANSIYTSANGNLYVMLYPPPNAGLLFSSDNGNSWKSVKHYIYGYTACVCPNGRIAVSGAYFNVSISDSTNDTLRTWKNVSYGLPQNKWITVLISDSSNNIFAATGYPHNYEKTSGKVYYLADNDTNWVERSNGLPDSIQVNILKPKENGIIFLGSFNQGIFRSTDNGNNWSEANNGLSGKVIRSITFNKKGEVFACNERGVFISKNNGDNWLLVNSGLPDTVGVISLAINREDHIFALSANRYLYYSINNGNSWNIARDTLFLERRNLDYDDYDLSVAISSNDYLYAVYANILYISTDPVTGIEDHENMDEHVPETFNLGQNYPNPFNQTTTISYSIPKESFVELKIYNMLGREVSTLINKEQIPGEYKIQFNASALPSGMYIYTICAGEFRDSKKILLLK